MLQSTEQLPERKHREFDLPPDINPHRFIDFNTPLINLCEQRIQAITGGFMRVWRTIINLLSLSLEEMILGRGAKET